MVSIKQIATSLSVVLILSACATRPLYQEKPPEKDIYAPIRDNVIEYRDNAYAGSGVVNNASDDFVEGQIKQVRHLFFAQNYDQATQLAERLIRQAPNNPNAYYWLARVRLEVADYQQAYQMAEKGISVSVRGSAVRKALQRLHQQAGIGIH